MDKLEIKDLEIEVLNQEVKTAYNAIDALKKRVSDLEQTQNTSKTHQPPEVAAEPVSNPREVSDRSLFLGDTNLQSILPSDIENCALKDNTRSKC